MTSKRLSQFISLYCSWLLGCGATCIRLEKNVGRIARRYGKRVELTIMPRHIHLTVAPESHWPVTEEDSDGAVTSIVSVQKTHISYNINTRLSQLSWDIADRRVSFDQAMESLHDITEHDYQNQWLVTFLVTVANASFCRLFGGDLIAMATVAVATFVGYRLKLLLLAKGMDSRLVFFFCAFVSAVLGATDGLFGIGGTPSVALGTSVLYLVPGIPFLNSFSDMLYRHYICAFGRFMDAVVLTGCLSAGLYAAMVLMHVTMF